MKKIAIIILFMLMCVAVVGTTVFASADNNAYGFGDALNNNRVTITENDDGSQSLQLAVTDGNYSSTRAYYTKNVDVTNFTMQFTLDAFNTDGAMRISFLSGSGDFPMNSYGDGFGVYFWDETAWGLNGSLRSDFCTYKKSGTAAANDAKRVCSGENYVGQTFFLKVWNWDQDNLAISVTRNDAADPQAIGTYAKANLPDGFDLKNCVLMVSPDIDGSRAHSYAKDVKITVKEINGAIVGKKSFTVAATAGENGTVSATVTGKVKEGTQVTFTATPNENYTVDTATLNGDVVTLTDNQYTYTVNGDATFHVTFKEIPVQYFDVTATADENGSVTVSPSNRVAEGTEVTFTVTPNVAYKVDEAFVNGIPVALSNNAYTMQVNETVRFEVSFRQYSIGDDRFAYGIWDTLKNRADVSETNDGTKIMLAVQDGQVAQSRLYSAEKMSLSSFEMTFTIDALSVDGGFRISFLSTNDDYPMEGYGDGFALYFWDETAWGYAERTAIRSDLYSYFKSPAEKNVLKESATRNAAYLGNEFTLATKLNEDKTGLVITLKNKGETAFEETLTLTALPAGFSVENCVMLLSPEIDSSREHSKATPVEITVKSLVYAKATEGTTDVPPVVEEEKYSASYVIGESVVKTVYAEKGDLFFEWIPEDVEGFDGWYTDRTFTSKFDFSTEASEDIVLYAKVNAPTEKSGCASNVGASVSAGTLALDMILSGLILKSVVLYRKKETKD